jgi:hypothetical protein
MAADPVDPSQLSHPAALVRALDAVCAEVQRLEAAVAGGAILPDLSAIDRHISILCVAAGKIPGPKDAVIASLERTMDALDRLSIRMRGNGPLAARPARTPVSAAAAYAERGKPTRDD